MSASLLLVQQGAPDLESAISSKSPVPFSGRRV